MYFSIRISSSNRQCTNTLKAATPYRINQEIKFLYINKTKLNKQLYTRHLECTALWPNCWITIQETIDNNLQLEMEAYYENLNRKLDILQLDHKKPSSHAPLTSSKSLSPRRNKNY